MNSVYYIYIIEDSQSWCNGVIIDVLEGSTIHVLPMFVLFD